MEAFASTIGIILIIALTICGVAGWWPFGRSSQSTPVQRNRGVAATPAPAPAPTPTPPAAPAGGGGSGQAQSAKRGWGCLATIGVVATFLLILINGFQCGYHKMKDATRSYLEAVEEREKRLTDHYWFWELRDPDKPTAVDNGQFMTVTENSEAALVFHFPEEGCKTYRKFSARLGVNPENGLIVGGECEKAGSFPITGRFQVVTRKAGTLEPISCLVWYEKTTDEGIVSGKPYLLTMRVGNRK